MMAPSVSGPILLLVSLTAILVVTPSPLPSPAWATSTPANTPPEVLTHFTPEDVARGRAYMGGRYWLFAGGTALRLLALVLLVVTPASAALRSLAVRLAPTRPAVAVAIYIAMLVLAFELLTLPLGYYAGYVREHAFGLSTQTRIAWVLDRAKAALILLALAVPLGSLLALLWRRYPGHWVLPAWALAGLATILLVALAPVVIDPLFHTIQPLRDPDLRQRLIALAGGGGLGGRGERDGRKPADPEGERLLHRPGPHETDRPVRHPPGGERARRGGAGPGPRDRPLEAGPHLEGNRPEPARHGDRFLVRCPCPGVGGAPGGPFPLPAPGPGGAPALFPPA